MARAAALFVATSLALHGAAIGLVVAPSGFDTLRASPTRDAERAPIPVLLEGTNLPPGAPTATTVTARPASAASTASLAAAGGPTPAALRAPPPSPAAGARGNAGGDAEGAQLAGDSTASGAGTSLFGTSVLRSFLLAISADPRALRDGAGPYRLRYAGGDGAAGRVVAEPHDAASGRMANALEALLAQAGEGLPAVAGALTIAFEDAEGAEGLFAITCDEARRQGSVRFVDGRRARVDEAP
jgi:hypothetical protein